MCINIIIIITEIAVRISCLPGTNGDDDDLPGDQWEMNTTLGAAYPREKGKRNKLLINLINW